MEDLYTNPGRNGYVDAMNRFNELYNQGHTPVDIMLRLGEEFDRGMVDTVLEEVRAQGLM